MGQGQVNKAEMLVWQMYWKEKLFGCFGWEGGG